MHSQAQGGSGGPHRPVPTGGTQLRREGGGGSSGKVSWKENPTLDQTLLLVLGQQLQVTAEDCSS